MLETDGAGHLLRDAEMRPSESDLRQILRGREGCCQAFQACEAAAGVANTTATAERRQP